jgi:hypothetical protein
LTGSVSDTIGSGVQSLEVKLEDATNGGLANTPAALARGIRAPLANTWQTTTLNGNSWSYPVTSNMEGLFNLRLRATDNNANTSEKGIQWRGMIDNVPPVITATARHLGNATAETEYTFTFTDFMLDNNSFAQPCAAGSLVSLTYNDNTLPNHGLTYQVSATCRVNGHETSRDLTACDRASLCTTLNITPIPLAVDLANFAATPESDDILIEWQTVSELDNLGFNLYRADTASLPELRGTERGLVQLNSSLIPAPCSGQGSAYEFVDQEVEMGETYVYWLEDVDTNGQTTLHGPVSASMSQPLAVTIDRLTVERGQSGELAWALLALIILGGALMGGRRGRRRD